jgi:hypothetical protein
MDRDVEDIFGATRFFGGFGGGTSDSSDWFACAQLRVARG